MWEHWIRSDLSFLSSDKRRECSGKWQGNHSWTNRSVTKSWKQSWSLAGWWQTCCSNLEPQVWQSLHASMEENYHTLFILFPISFSRATVSWFIFVTHYRHSCTLLILFLFCSYFFVHRWKQTIILFNFMCQKEWMPAVKTNPKSSSLMLSLHWIIFYLV